MIGTSIAHYRITAKLGEGGMGEVYRATDTKLQREVAIKVLPAAFTEDKERLARFEREAQLLAQLHHPHIASIFGIEESGATRALVMELVEGPTLAERLEKGSLPLDESLSLARQIAEALEEAHEKGIIHRDLKPQNIKASIEGKVKVLDFGLAKAMDPAGAASGQASASHLAQSPTLTIGATVQGMILGTAAYMSPEQAKGFAVDKRADIWAFGVLLYKMLAGGTLFAGDSVGDTLAAVIRAEIDLDRLPAETPGAIRRLIRRCLERNPKNRLHDIADARIVIDDVLGGKANEVALPAPTAVATLRRPGWILPAIAVTAVVAGFVAGKMGREPQMSSPDEVVVAQAIPNGTGISLADLLEIAISPDGRRQAVVVETKPGLTQILLRDLDEPAPRLLPGTEDGHGPFFSPDGGNVGFFVDNGIRRVSVAGGPALQISNDVTGVFAARGAAWSRDGFVYFSQSTASPLVRVSENGGATEEVTHLDTARDERTHRWPAALPDGSALLFTCDTAATTEYYDDARIEAVRVATGERKVVVERSSMARFLPPDRLVFARGGMLFAQRFDPRRLEVRGEPVALGRQIRTQVASGAAEFALAENGTLIWIPGEGIESNREAVWISADGSESPVAGLPSGSYTQIALAPDGRHAVVGISTPPDLGLSVVDLDRATLSRLTFETTALNPVWTRDGSRIAYAATTKEEKIPGIVLKRSDGSGDAQLLLRTEVATGPMSFTPDDRSLVFLQRLDVNQGQAWLLPLDGSGAARSLHLSEDSQSFQAEVSPDGRWIAYVTLESGRMEVYLRPFPSGEGKWQVSSDGGSEPHWSRQGDAIYFRTGGGIHRVSFQASGGVRLGRPERVGSTLFSGTLPATFSVAADGRILTLRYVGGRSQIHQVDLALGWGSKVEALLKAKR